MTLHQLEHPEAAAEFDAAVHWYEEQSPGAGHTLIDHAVEARARIAEWPESGVPVMTVDDGTVFRMRSVRGFPLRIVYVVDPTVIHILAYAHERREPGYWLTRLSS